MDGDFGFAGNTKSHLKFRPIGPRPDQTQVTSVEPCELAGQIEAQAVARNILIGSPPVKALKYALLRIRGDWGSGIADGKENPAFMLVAAYPDGSALTVIFAGVFQ